MDRLDRALIADLASVLRHPVSLAFVTLEAVATLTLMLRRGDAVLGTVAVVWMGLLSVAFLAWWAGRHRLAVQVRDPVPAPVVRAASALMASLGLLIAGLGGWVMGAVLVVLGLLVWLLAGDSSGGNDRESGRRLLLRDPRPFVPLLLLVGLTRLLFGGLEPVGLIAGLVSGVVQQVAYLVGLFAPLEALRARTDVAAVAAALVFGLVHLPFDLEPNHGDWVAATANAVMFQASVGMVAALAFVRHRAPLPIGVVHGLAIA